MKKSLNYMLALVLVFLCAVIVVPVFAGASGLTGATISVDEFSPSGGLTFKDQVHTSLDSLDTAVDAVIAYQDAGAIAGVAAAPTVAGSVSGTTNTVTITAKDGAGATIAAKRLVRVWMSETTGGAPSTNNIESVTLSGGAAIQTVVAAADYVYLTAATGIASAAVIGTAAGTNYINVADGGYVTSAAVVFE
jgi:hypothetical protein